jgi:transcriptional regulator with XRE-family HTH domain
MRVQNAGGIQLEIERLKLGLTQMGLAVKLDVESAKVSAWERGAKKPGPEARTRINAKYGIDWPAWEAAPTREQASELRRLRDATQTARKGRRAA